MKGPGGRHPGFFMHRPQYTQIIGYITCWFFMCLLRPTIFYFILFKEDCRRCSPLFLCSISRDTYSIFNIV